MKYHTRWINSNPVVGPKFGNSLNMTPIKLLDVASRIVAYLAHAAVLVCAYVLFIYAHPVADDFCRKAKELDLGVLGGIRNEYLTWSGRWGLEAIFYGVASVFDLISSYSFLLALIASIYAFALIAFFVTILRYDFPRKYALMLAISLFVLYWSNLRSPGQTFYWFTGSAAYQFSFAGILFLFAGLLRVRTTSGWIRWIQIIFLSLLAISISGIHELCGLICVVVLGVGFSIALKRGHPNRWVWGIVLLFSALGLSTVFLAPGNEFRKLDTNQVVRYGDFKLALALTIKQVALYARRWVLDVTLLSATLFLILTPTFRSVRPPWFSQHPLQWKMVIPVTWIVLLVIAIFLPGWGLGKPMPPRISDFIYMLFLIGWILTVFLFTRRPIDKSIADDVGIKAVRALALTVFGLSLIVSSNMLGAAQDLLKGVAAAYHQNMQRRYVLVYEKLENGETDVRVPIVEGRPMTFHRRFEWAGLKTDPDHWQNQCTASFFKLRSIAVEP